MAVESTVRVFRSDRDRSGNKVLGGVVVCPMTDKTGHSVDFYGLDLEAYKDLIEDMEGYHGRTYGELVELRGFNNGAG